MPDCFPNPTAPVGSSSARSAASMLKMKSYAVVMSVRTVRRNSMSYAEGAVSGVPSSAYSDTVSTTLSSRAGGRPVELPQAASAARAARAPSAAHGERAAASVARSWSSGGGRSWWPSPPPTRCWSCSSSPPPTWAGSSSTSAAIARPSPACSKRARRVTPASSSIPAGRPRRLLIVDDEPHIGLLLRPYFEAMGHDLGLARTLAEARAAFADRGAPPTGLLLHLHPPH